MARQFGINVAELPVIWGAVIVTIVNTPIILADSHITGSPDYRDAHCYTASIGPKRLDHVAREAG